MRRWVTRLAVFLLLGAIVNIGVAWGCAAWVRPASKAIGFGTLIVSRAERPRWSVEWIEGWGAIRYTYYPEQVTLAANDAVVMDAHPTWSRTAQKTAITLHGGAPTWILVENMIVEDARGWPFFALRCEFVIANPLATFHMYAVDVHSGIPLERVYRDGPPVPLPGVLPLRPDYYGASALPLRPIWPGFAINTIFYAAILWLLTLGPFALRRHLRRKRGLCAKCGYDLRGNSGGGGRGGCPECGWRREEKVEA